MSVRASARAARRRPWRERLRHEFSRQLIAQVIAVAGGTAMVLLNPTINWVTTSHTSERVAMLLIVFVLIVSLYSAAFAVLTHLALRHLPRPDLVAIARISRVRRSSRLLRLLGLSSTTGAEAVQMIASAIAMVWVLQNRPPHVPLGYLLLVTVLALVAAWMSCATGYAVDYAAADGHGDGFRLDGQEDPSGRAWPEYLYVAILVQTSSAPADFAPLTREARRSILGQSVLAHIMATVVVAVGASAIFTQL